MAQDGMIQFLKQKYIDGIKQYFSAREISNETGENFSTVNANLANLRKHKTVDFTMIINKARIDNRCGRKLVYGYRFKKL